MSKHYFKDYEESEDAAPQFDASEERSEEESFPEPEFEEITEGASLFTRETKIGLAVVLVLLIVLGVVLVKRLSSSSNPADAKQATAKSEPQKSESSSQNKTSSPVPKPTVITPPPGGSRHAPPSESPPWNPSGGGTSSKEGSGSGVWGRTSWDRPSSGFSQPSSGSLTSVRPSEPVGNAWGREQGTNNTLGASSSPSAVVPNSPSGTFPPRDPSPGSTNPLRQAHLYEAGQPSLQSGNVPPVSNPPGSNPAKPSHWGNYNPAREGAYYDNRISSPNTGSSGSFNTPYTPPVYSGGGPTGDSGGNIRNPGQGPTPGTERSITGSSSNSWPTIASQGTSSPQPSGLTPLASPSQPAAAPTGARSYVVQSGDSYWSIAERFYGAGTYYQALAEYNRSRIPRPEQLRVGDQLLIPSREELEQAYPQLCPRTPTRPDVSSSPAGGSAAGFSSAVGPPSPRENSSFSNPFDRKPQETPPSPSPRQLRVYIVQEGDNLYEIARYLLGKPSRWVEIYELNKDILGDDLEHLRPGTQLAIPPAESGGSPGPMSAIPPRPMPR